MVSVENCILPPSQTVVSPGLTLGVEGLGRNCNWKKLEVSVVQPSNSTIT